MSGVRSYSGGGTADAWVTAAIWAGTTADAGLTTTVWPATAGTCHAVSAESDAEPCLVTVQ